MLVAKGLFLRRVSAWSTFTKRQKLWLQKKESVILDYRLGENRAIYYLMYKTLKCTAAYSNPVGLLIVAEKPFFVLNKAVRRIKGISKKSGIITGEWGTPIKTVTGVSCR